MQNPAMTMLWTTLVLVLSSAEGTVAEVRDSMVKIYSVQTRPDYDNPWKVGGPVSTGGSGCVIEGHRILTNAHVISD